MSHATALPPKKQFDMKTAMIKKKEKNFNISYDFIKIKPYSKLGKYFQIKFSHFLYIPSFFSMMPHIFFLPFHMSLR